MNDCTSVHCMHCYQATKWKAWPLNLEATPSTNHHYKNFGFALKLIKDAMEPASCLFVIFLLFLQLCSCVPQQLEISQQPEGSPFDVGPQESCQVPQTTYCTDVTYQVPASIARLTEFIEFEIRNIVEPADDQSVPQDCIIVYKETLCHKKFPRCLSQLNQVYFETSVNCEERLRRSCPNRVDSVIKLGYCNTTEFILHSGSCRSLSSSNELQHCNLLERDILVSDWMFEYIRQVDLNLQQEYPLRLLSSQSECWQRYRNFLCSAVGRCVGSRVQLVNTMETCEEVLTW